MELATLNTEPRAILGSAESRRIRRGGRIPTVVYGLEKAPHSCTVDARAFDAEFHRGLRTYNLVIAGKQEAALLKSIQMDTYGKDVVHLDFHRVDLTVKVRVAVPLSFIGHAEINAAGIVDHVAEDIHVECLPTDIPPSLEVSLEGLQVGKRIEAKDVKLTTGLVLADDPHKVIVSYHWRHAEVVAPVAEVAPAADAAAKPADGAKPAAPAAKSDAKK